MACRHSRRRGTGQIGRRQAGEAGEAGTGRGTPTARPPRAPLTREPRPQLLPLAGHAHGAVVGVADAGHDAAGGDHGHGAKAILVGAEGGHDEHVPPRAHAAVAAQHHPLPQAVGGQGLVRLRGASTRGRGGAVRQAVRRGEEQGGAGRGGAALPKHPLQACRVGAPCPPRRRLPRHAAEAAAPATAWRPPETPPPRAAAPLCLSPARHPTPLQPHLCQPHLDGASAVLDGGDGRGAGAAVVARYLDNVGVGLGHARGHGADPRLRHQLDRHLGGLVDLRVGCGEGWGGRRVGVRRPKQGL